MTDDDMKQLLWLRDNGVKSYTERPNEVSVEFWNPPPPSQSKVDIAAVLGAAMTDEELYGYDVPEHLKDPDDVTQGETK